jgi:imidazolonepropionase-like amidohydrolase
LPTPDIPWGIDANELMLMMHLANMPMLEVLRSATSKAVVHLDLPLLGTLQANAPADLIAVKATPEKTLNYWTDVTQPLNIAAQQKPVELL